MCSVGPKGKHGVRNMARAHLCLHGPLLLHTRPESNRGTCGRWAPRSKRMLPQPAAGHSRIAAGKIRLARRPTASAVNAPPSAAGRLAPRGSTAAAAAAPSNATKTAARRPSSRLPDRPKRPEQAPADDRSHRRIDAGTSRVRAPRRHGLASRPGKMSNYHLKILYIPRDSSLQ